MRLGASAAVALLVAAGMACDTVDTGGVVGPQRDATVTMGTNYFSPIGVTIPVGGKVLWVWPGQTHNVDFGGVPDAPTGCGNIAVGECLRSFPVAGIFNYNCTLHPGMIGSVTVQ